MTVQFCNRTDRLVGTGLTRIFNNPLLPYVHLFSMFATGSCDATTRIWRYREGAWQAHTLTIDPQEIAR